MVLEWFSGGKEASVPELLAKKRYDKAAELLRNEIRKRPHDEQPRIQLAEVLALVGKTEAASLILIGLADDFAARGFAAKAIAMLKKVQKLDKATPEIEEKLARLIRESQTSDSAALRQAGPDPAFEPGVEESEPESPTSDIPPPSTIAKEIVSPNLRHSSSATTETAPDESPAETLQPSNLVQQAEPEPQEDSRPIRSPLFADFSGEELVAVIKGLELISSQPGDIIVTEGEAGDSLFVIATGAVKAFVKTPNGASVQIREMSDGDFFGEIALLTGKARTATITAATRCDLLELDRPALDLITKSHPKVRQILLDFYNERAHNAAEAMIRGIEIESEAPETVEPPVKVEAEPEAVAMNMENATRAVELYDGAIAATRSSNWQAAFPLWKEYASMKPDDVQASNVLGVVSAKLEKWSDAAEAFSRASLNTPNDASVFYNLGIACGKLGRVDDARNAYQQAVRLKPDYEKAKQSLAKLQGARG